MGLVKYALKFRVSFYVLSVLILFLGIGAIVTMPKDVFPSVNIPVVTIIWTYTGLTTPEMEKRVTTYSEYSLSNNINGIRNIERSEEHTSELQSQFHLVCRLLLEKK